MVNHKHYTYRVLWSEEDGEYVALCAEFPSLSYLSSDQGKALTGLTHLVGEVVRDMLSHGETPPEPISLRQYSGRLVLRIPPETHRLLTINASEQGVSLNQYLNLKLA